MSRQSSTDDLTALAEGLAERPLRPALLRGWRRRCPNCGDGPLMQGYLTVRPSCPVCGTDFSPHRADDGPAYLTILIVGHVTIPALAYVFSTFRPDPAILATGFALGATTLSLWLLPRLKGAIVGYQWSRRMHGFGRP